VVLLIVLRMSEIVEQTLLKQKLVSQIYQVDRRTGGGTETIKSRLVNLKNRCKLQEELKSTE
jgi:hypothetical protein